MNQNKRDEKGSTLIEVLITTLLLGICGTVIVGALGTATASSATQQSIATANTILTGYAETAKYEIELQPSPIFKDCATTYTVNYANSNLTSASSVGITAVIPFDPTTGNFDTLANCATSGDDGLQQLTITVTGPAQVKESMTIVVRNPAVEASYAGF